MSQKSLSLTLRQTKMGWCVFLNGVAYALGSRAYCIGVVNDLRKGGAA